MSFSKIRIFLVCLLLLMAQGMALEDVPTGPIDEGSTNPVTVDEDDKTSIFVSLMKQYKKLKQFVGAYIVTVNAVSDLLYASYLVLEKWEAIAKKTEYLMSTNPFTDDPVSTIENLEMMFRTSDELLFEDVPSGLASVDNLKKKKDALMNNLRGGAHIPTSYTGGSNAFMKGYIEMMGFEDRVDENGITLLYDEDVFAQNSVKATGEGMGKAYDAVAFSKQEEAITSAIGHDVYDVYSCKNDGGACGSISARADVEAKIVHSSQRILANEIRSEQNSIQAGLEEVLIAVNTYNTQGMISTARVGGVLTLYNKMVDMYGIDKLKRVTTPYMHTDKYPRAYKYDGKVFGPTESYWD
jgi:hypothetical protein